MSQRLDASGIGGAGSQVFLQSWKINTSLSRGGVGGMTPSKTGLDISSEGGAQSRNQCLVASFALKQIPKVNVAYCQGALALGLTAERTSFLQFPLARLHLGRCPSGHLSKMTTQTPISPLKLHFKHVPLLALLFLSITALFVLHFI